MMNPRCLFETMPVEMIACVLSFVPVLDYYNLKLAGSRYINDAVRFVSPCLSRGEYCQQLTKEYTLRYGSQKGPRKGSWKAPKVTRSAMEIMIERDQGALVQHYLKKYQGRGSHGHENNKPHQERENRVFRSALHWAAFYGSVSVARLLLDKIYIRSPKSGDSPLHIAARNGHTGIADLLLANGAEIDLVNAYGWTPLHLALNYEKEAVVNLFRSKGAAEGPDEIQQKGWASFRGSLRKADFPITMDQLYKESKASKPGKSESPCSIEPAFLDRTFGAFAMYQFSKNTTSGAQKHRRLKHLVKLIISNDHPGLLMSILDDGFCPRTPIFHGSTALHLAALWSRDSILEILLEQKTERVSLREARNERDSTPLHLAIVDERRVAFPPPKNQVPIKYCDTPFHRESHSCLRLLLEDGADIHARDNLKRSPLHLAAVYGKAEASRLLLDHGADVNAQSSNHSTPLHFASHPRITKLLLEYGANVHARDWRGRTPAHRHILRCLSTETPAQDKEVCDILRSKGADFDAKDYSDATCLNMAVSSRSPHMVNKILSFGVDVNNIERSTGHSPLTCAFRMYRASLGQEILDYGADPNILNEGSPPLSFAVDNGIFEIFQNLVDHGADIHWKDRYQRTFLHCTLINGPKNYINIRKLLELGVDVNAKDDVGNTALHLAARTGKDSLVHLLLEYGAAVNITGNQGYTALHYLARDCRGPAKEVIKLLMDNGADVNARSVDDDMPIHLAARRESNHHIVKVLLEFGAEVNARDKRGRTPFHCAVSQNTPWVEDLLEVLLRHGARVDVHDEDGLTPLDTARDLKIEAYVDSIIQGPKSQ